VGSRSIANVAPAARGRGHVSTTPSDVVGAWKNDPVRTAVTDMFGIDLPILAFSHCRDVVAAVSRAGGLGVLGATGHSPEDLSIDLKWITEEVKGAPFGVDVLLPVRHATSSDADPMTPAHEEFVNDLLVRHGLDPLTADDQRGRRPAGAPSLLEPEDLARELLEVAFDYPIALVASALGPPPPSLLDAARTHGARVAALAGKVSHAVRHAAVGVDLIVAQGTEAGGHTGEISTMVLVPEVVDAVAPIPVLAAGGIGRGRQIAASLALGAEGVWCGSVWLTTDEAETGAVVKEKFLAATSSDTVRSRARTGKPARQLRSAWTAAWEDPAAPSPLPLPSQSRLSEPSLARSEKSAEAGNDRARELATYFVGQIVGSMNQAKPTRRVVVEMIEELIEATESLNAKLHG
jgi:NAD(P)H-dependent flavin oxidoreductase YrpB (nitropropane dioxygenase family)